MPKIAKKLSPLAVSKLAHPDPTSKVPHFVPVGGVAGLMLQITPNGAKSWVLRVMINGIRRHIGLGSYPATPLSGIRRLPATAELASLPDEARVLLGSREKAEALREAIRRGIDPIAEKRKAAEATQDALRKSLTLGEAIERYLRDATDLTGRNLDRWRQTLSASDDGETRGHIPQQTLDMAVSAIETTHVLSILQPIWTRHTETAKKLRGRIETVLDWATLHKHRSGENPARWRGHLDKVLTAPSKVAIVRHQPALTIEDAPRWFASLRARDSVSARALQFLALTAVRSGDVRGAIWSEIDINARVWTIPAARLKIRANGPHRVPLTDAMIELLERQRSEDCEFVFPSTRKTPLSDMALSMMMRGLHESEIAAGRRGWLDANSGAPAVPHGLRSTFRDWCAERTNYPAIVAEQALAHTIGNKVEAAYRRGDLFDKRVELMRDWNIYLRSD